MAEALARGVVVEVIPLVTGSAHARGIAVSKSGDLYVANQQHASLVRFRIDAAHVATYRHALADPTTLCTVRFLSAVR